MALNIKNPRAVALASAVAAAAGETMTSAIIHALEERLQRLQARRDVPSVLQSIIEISDRCAALPDLDSRSADQILGYDADGTFGQGRMVIDASAIVAILCRGADRDTLAERLARPEPRLMSSVSALEAAIVMSARKGPLAHRELDGLLHRIGIDIVAFDLRQSDIARAAYVRFGRGRHPAALNFGDCCSYALARHTGEPLLFKGVVAGREQAEALSRGRERRRLALALRADGPPRSSPHGRRCPTRPLRPPGRSPLGSGVTLRSGAAVSRSWCACRAWPPWPASARTSRGC